jgi:hypothetical protein
MTFLEIQDRVMDRLNLSAAVARVRIKTFINERNRAVCTSVNVGRVRRTTVEALAASGVRTLTPSGIVKPLTIRIPALHTVLEEHASDQLRNYDPREEFTGVPDWYAVATYDHNSFDLELCPIPDQDYTLSIDGIARGIDLSDDGDIPGFPEDFHDILVFGASADELDHIGMEKELAQSRKMELKYEQRLSELRYWIQKSIYLQRGQNVEGAPSRWYLYGTTWYRP